jgi:hypothetical protein
LWDCLAKVQGELDDLRVWSVILYDQGEPDVFSHMKCPVEIGGHNSYHGCVFSPSRLWVRTAEYILAFTTFNRLDSYLHLWWEGGSLLWCRMGH